jgi:hypothetical protein
MATMQGLGGTPAYSTFCTATRYAKGEGVAALWAFHGLKFTR